MKTILNLLAILIIAVCVNLLFKPKPTKDEVKRNNTDWNLHTSTNTPFEGVQYK
jgi:hypothetical protein